MAINSILLIQNKSTSKMFKIKATADTVYQSSSLRNFGMPVKSHLNGSYSAEQLFDTEQEAKDYLISRVEMFYDDEKELNNAIKEVQDYGSIRLDAAYASIEVVELNECE